MKKLILELKKLKDIVNIEESFNWEIPNPPIVIPDNLTNNFEKNIYLKNHLSDLLKNDTDMSLHYWIIQEWGGIKSFKRNERNDERIRKFKIQLEKGQLTQESFGLISSLSKIASFLDPEQYAIYDSRVIYALNWLLLLHTDIHDYFPQPAGRNKNLLKYDMRTIIRLADPSFRNLEPEDISSPKRYKTAFHEYSILMKNLSSEVYGTDAPYMTEMLLFKSAENIIINQIQSSLKMELIKY